MQTTLNKIREYSPSENSWEKLLTALGKTQADDAPVSIVQILDSNGLDDAVWCLRAVDGCDLEIRQFAVWCASQVRYLVTDLQNTIDSAAPDVASSAVYVASYAASESLDVASDATYVASDAAEAASDAAAAAYAAACVATYVVSDSLADAAAATYEAAYAAARAAQADELRRICQ